MGAPVLIPDLGTRSSGGPQVCLQMDRTLLKAHAAIEGGQRVVYMEASTDARDLQGERVLLSALEASIPYFLKYGRIDLDHASVLGQIRGQKVNPYAFEIGKPLDAKVQDGSVWVKAAIFSSTDEGNRFTEAADIFWDSLHTNPPVSWFPSIAGEVFSEAPTTHDGLPTQEVRGLRWHSIGLSRTPVNHHVAPISTVPLRAFAKAFGSVGDLTSILKILTPVSAPQSLSVPPAASTGVDSTPEVIQKATEALRETDASQGIDGYLKRAADKGVAPEVALGLMVVLLSKH